ncbi:MAG: glycosyltransferase family 39 protein [Nanoarchaeota archaeon]
MEEQEKRETKKEKLSAFFKDRLNILAFAVIIFGITIRLYYLFLAGNQPLWWDESELMLYAKHIGLNTPDTGWFPYREPLLPIFWGLLFKLGANELFIRFIEFLFSITAIIFTYLFGKEIFDKKTAIIATSLLSVFYLHIFYSLRFMSEAPTLAFVTIAVYYFWKGYVNKICLKHLLISGLAIAIGFLSYYAVGFIALTIFLHLLITDRFKFLKNRKLWIAAAIIILLMLPYFIYSMITIGAPIPRLAAVKESITNPETTKVYGAWSLYLNLFPVYLQSLLLIVFLIAFLYILINIILGIDLLVKDENMNAKKDFFLFLWIVIPLVVLSYIAINTSGHGEDRYLILIFPAVFLVASRLILKISDYIKKIDKRLSLTFILLLLIVIGFQQISYGNSLIKSKLASYEPVKQAGLWLKQNSRQGDVVISNSIPQNTYYSERATYYAFEDTKIKSYKPRFFVVSIFENSGETYFKYPENHQDELIPVQAYFADLEKKQPLLIIYEFKKVS